MNKLPIRILVISIIIVTLLLSLFFFVDKNKKVIKSQPSAFNSLVKNQTEKPGQPKDGAIDSGVADFFDKNGGELKNVPYGLNIFLLGLSIMEFNHEATWDYTNIPFWAEIVSASKDTSSLTLKFISPKSMPYLNEQKEVQVVGCEKYNSFLTIENPRSAQTDLDFFSKLMYGDDMIGYCLDQECAQVGRLCKLYRD